MAKGAKRKTKWVSLSLANTTTSVATGSDSEQQPHHHPSHHHYGAGAGVEDPPTRTHMFPGTEKLFLARSTTRVRGPLRGARQG
ncbi:AGAP012234-PA-like protein [Anopheles sinensis]|uniref:AGAP012234-PA-like protein n=1 Tax=Anopheles sinensis TaxID=74873 RepID=A0A084WB58_ANOSI|nr:AGAP012234-PA-like protein [Anopheles sinensis]